MPRFEVLAAAGLGLIALTVLYVAVRGLQTGVMSSRYGRYERAESPLFYWIMVAAHFIGGGVVLPLVMRAILRGA